MRKLMFCFALSIFTAGMVVAENLIKSDEQNWTNVTLEEKGKSKWLQNTRGFAKNNSMVEVDKNAKYKLSCKLMISDPPPKMVFVGLTPHCAEKQPIKIWQVNNLAGTATELTADAKAGNTIIKVKDTSKWEKYKYAVVPVVIAFNTKDDLSDLPNRDTVRGIIEIEKGDDSTTVTLGNALKKDYPAGTKIRLHSYGGHHMYAILVKTKSLSPTEGKEFSATVTGIAKHGGPRLKFWKGTKFVNVFVFVTRRGKVLFKDVKLEKVE